MSNDTNGNVTFSITATNSSGGRVSFTESDLDTDSFVTIDTISPTISLNGENDTVVALGEPYTYLGATAYDLSYGNTQVSTTDRVNVNQLGHYTLHYTAPTDAAGNTGPTIIQIVEVLDAPPINITLLSITSNNNNNSYAKAGDTLTIQSSINYTIVNYTATIFGIEQSESNQNSKGFLISQQVPSDIAVEEYASFSITIIDEKGLPNTITQNTNITSSQLPPENVFVDTISPTITKLLPESITFKANANLSNITTTVNDGAPNYVTSITIDPSTIVNTSIPGVYPFTYSAPDDAAGNPGQSATINFIVEDGDGSTVLNSSIIDDTPQSFSNSERIIAKIHDNNVNASNSLSSPPPEELVLFSFAVERCDVHNVTVRAVLSCVYMARSPEWLRFGVFIIVRALALSVTIPEYNVTFMYGSVVFSRMYTVGDELTRSNVIAIALLESA